MSGFISSVELVAARVAFPDTYPFAIPAVAALREKLRLHPKVSFLVGENGTGKSTIIEAIAVTAGFNAEGGTTNFRFSNRPSESELSRAIRLSRTAIRAANGFFLRAESFFNVATNIEAGSRTWTWPTGD